MCDDEGFGPSNVEECAAWLDTKYRRQGEIEDKESADHLRRLKADNECLRLLLNQARPYVDYGQRFAMRLDTDRPAVALLHDINALLAPSAQEAKP